MFYLVSEYATRKKLVPDCMTHVPDFGTSFLVPKSGTGFWYACRGHYNAQQRILAFAMWRYNAMGYYAGRI